MPADLEAALAALERDPDDPHVHLAVSRAHLVDGNAFAAAAHLSQATRSGIEAPEDWRAVGRAHLAAGEHRAAAAALDRAVVGRPGDAELRRLNAEAWQAHLRAGGASPHPRGRVLCSQRAEVAIFGLACASWDLVGSCFAHFVARWLADATSAARPAVTVLPGGRSRRRRAHPEPPSPALLAEVSARTGAGLAVHGELVLAGGPDPGIRVCIVHPAPDKEPQPAQWAAPLSSGRIAAATAEVLGPVLDTLVPGDAAAAARADLAALAALPDDAFLELVVLAELGARGRVELARRVAASSRRVAFAAAVCRRAAAELADTNPEAACDLAEALHGARPDDLEVVLVFGRLGAAMGRPGATGLLSRVAREGEGGLAAEALTLRARLHYDAGRHDAGREALEAAIARHPPHGPARRAMAALCRAEGDVEGLVRHLVAGLPALPITDREAEIDAASELILAAGRDDALLDLAAAATADGTNTPLLAAAYAAGAVRSGSSRVRRALVLLEPHLDADLPDEMKDGIRSLYVEACCRVATTSRAVDDLLDALRRYRRALDVDGDSAAARLGAGEVLLDLDRPEEAYTVLQDAPACPGAEPHVWVLLARTLLVLGREDDARIAAKRAGDAAHDHPELGRLVSPPHPP